MRGLYNTISHSVLLRKLSRYGVYDMKLQWFIVYLLLGKQIVQFNVVLYVTEFCVTFRA